MKWPFWYIDKYIRVSFISKVIDMLMKRETKLEFMTYKKELSPLSCYFSCSSFAPNS
jgi:hypothetical protein